MKRFLFVAAAAILISNPLFAQTGVVTTPAPRAGTTVTIAPEQRTKIKQYVVQHPVKPYAMRERMAIGTTVPAEAELYPVPGDWGPGLGNYRYIYSGNTVGLVEPSSRRVIEIIE
ncbi:MAG: DUF1236 domain-containing protein [Xanthobacteraceae bacterium]|nr:DUF1236 domain-containing protein [Xanthobacteraceae bacterium]MBV8747032.1 DUF1236 domain-containing protein [Xanthobacteraceae bacterium]MBV9629927.1 DUF1236 domain-containing protein [Xanthobacteraceae bacterium]